MLCEPKEWSMAEKIWQLLSLASMYILIGHPVRMFIYHEKSWCQNNW